jgi:DNA modification methylase
LNDRLTILQGDALTKLRELPDESVQCCVTSPPYWGLRDYGTAQWEGSVNGCDHLEVNDERDPAICKQTTSAGTSRLQFKETCGKCGARRIESQLGLEKTPEEYVAKMVEVFREVRRVLRNDGTLWLNLGSTYAGGGRGGNPPESEHQKQATNAGSLTAAGVRRGALSNDKSGTEQVDSRARDYACSDLCDGCEATFLSRNAGNFQPSPESFSLLDKTVRDKLHLDFVATITDGAPPDVPASTKNESSEQPQGECSHCANCGACLSVLRSSSRDASLCARRASCNGDTSGRESVFRNQGKDVSGLAYSTIAFPQFKDKDLIPIPWMVAMALQADGWWLRQDSIWAKRNCMPESVTDRCTKSHEYLFLLTKSARYFWDSEAIKEEAEYGRRNWSVQQFKEGDITVGHGKNGGSVTGGDPSAGRNKRSVWTVATAPYPEAHFATYPPDLIKPCILAGTSAKGCCAKCGAPWERVVDTEKHPRGDNFGKREGAFDRGQAGSVYMETISTKTTGWQPTCECQKGHGIMYEGDLEPCAILDPFAGSGTTGQVALELGRKAILIELNPKYVELIERRCDVTPGLALS